MLRTANAPALHDRVFGLRRLRRRSRSVTVRVIEGGREVDSFRVSNPHTLRSALRPIETHLSRKSGVVQYRGVEEESLPMGIDRISREVDLDNLGSAVSFLVA